MNFLQKIIRYLFIIVCCSHPFCGRSQYQNLQFKHLTADDGLTQSWINNIFTDSKGFVWMTGLDGINRFNGLKCIANDEIGTGLTGITQTRGIVEDKNGDIWFGYVEGLIRYSYTANRFEIIKLSIPQFEKRKNEEVIFEPLTLDGDNNILLHYSADFAFSFNPFDQKLIAIPITPKRPTHNAQLFLRGDPRNLYKNLYRTEFGQDSFFVYHFRRADQLSLSWDKVFSVKWKEGIGGSTLLADDSTLIIYSGYQIGKYDFKSGLFELKSFPFLFMPVISSDINKNIWIGSKEGVYVVDRNTLEITAHFIHEPGNAKTISNGNTINAYCDNRATIWLSINGSGVDYCNLTDLKFSSAFTSDQSNNYRTGNMIRDIVEDPDGGFYCSAGKHIVQLDKNLNYLKNFTFPLTISSIPDIHLAGKFLFVALDVNSSPELIVYNIANNNTKHITHSAEIAKPANLVYQFSPMSDGNLLTATYGGLWKLNTTTQKFEELSGITDTTDIAVFSYMDKHGQIYKGINTRGFSVYQKVATQYKKVFSLDRRITVKHCYEMDDSLMWIGTTDGLYLFNTIKLRIKKQYTSANGLANNVIYAIMPNEKGNLWLSTNKGLSYFYVGTEKFKNFSKEDGLQANEFNTHAVVRARDGRIIFGGVNGLTVINPQILQKKTTMPAAQVTAIKTDSSYNPFAFDEERKLRLPAGNNTIDFEISALDYINPAECRIQYRLKGYDDKWNEAGNPAIVRFVKLHPGDYELEYRVSNTEGDWDDQIKTFSFSIGAYWWQTGWFRGLLVLAIIIISFLFIRIYIRTRLHRQKLALEKYVAVQKERERIISDLHDDVGATLSSMHIYGDLAENVWEKQPEKSKEMVNKITLQSKDLMNRMSDIVWSLKSPAEEKNSFSIRLRNYSQELLAEKGISTDFDTDEALSGKIINPLVRKNLLLIAKEAMNNISKYSGATKSLIKLKEEDGRMLFSISDNGHGFDKEIKKTGNGLGNMRQRCLQLNGEYLLDTEPGKGVTITCKVPIAIISHPG